MTPVAAPSRATVPATPMTTNKVETTTVTTSLKTEPAPSKNILVTALSHLMRAIARVVWFIFAEILLAFVAVPVALVADTIKLVGGTILFVGRGIGNIAGYQTIGGWLNFMSGKA